MGLGLVFLASVIVVLGSIFYLYRPRRWKQLYLYAYRISPYTAPPVNQINQQSKLTASRQAFYSARLTAWHSYGYE